MDIYYNKYLKYKKKYINLLNKQNGGEICQNNKFIEYNISQDDKEYRKLDISNINNYNELILKIEEDVNNIYKDNNIYKYKILKLFGKFSQQINNDNKEIICGEKIKIIFTKIYNYKYINKDNNYIQFIFLFINNIDNIKDIFKISKEKPVSTMNSITNSDGIYNISVYNIIKYNWNGFLDQTKIKILNNLSHRIIYNNQYQINDVNRIKMNIYINEDFLDDNSYQSIFYCEEYLNILCTIFNYTLQQGLEILSKLKEKNEEKEMAFILIAFGDLFKPEFNIDDNIITKYKDLFKNYYDKLQIKYPEKYKHLLSLE